MTLFNGLYSKLAIAFLLLVSFLGVSLLSISQSVSEHYSQEVMQRLNQSVAMYVTEQQQLIFDEKVDESALDKLAARAMILNPSLEIYVLDPRGVILSHRLPGNTVSLKQVNFEPIKHYLNSTKPFPILGTDPRDANKQNAFSVSPIVENGQTLGYVYAIIGGQLYQQLRDSVKDSYVLQIGALTILASVLAAALVGCVLFFLLTRRLTRLTNIVKSYDPANPNNVNEQFAKKQDDETDLDSLPIRDEIDQLSVTFQKMARHSAQQFEALKELDKTRRDLMANVSHDLRTPLSSMQGYIETLLIKEGKIDREQRREYLNVAHKHSRRLAQLISELFELAKLESSTIEPTLEPFSLLELAHDCTQEFGLKAEKKNIALEIQAQDDDCFVVADIALIHTVLQNLVDNALTHTPEGGKVSIKISKRDGQGYVEVADTGKGIGSHEIPYIFERFYQSQQQSDSNKIGTGLGLAIVKRIIDLHKTTIKVDSELARGTSFQFMLPQHQAV